jgi:hypothetical protein
MNKERDKQMEDILKSLQEKERKEKEREELLIKRKQRKREMEKIYSKKYYAIEENKQRHRDRCREHYRQNKDKILKRQAERQYGL